ncbi:MAG TPA: D-glycerate dehydrogenase [Casimicrobiaceae bacterium]|nr:D-glycerate dehydrogenase [Casimicrobiaceae bacterium]
MKKKPRVVATRKLPPAVEARLTRDYDAILNLDDRVIGADELVSLARGADALIVAPTERIDASLIARLPPSLRIIACYSVGFDNVDAAAAVKRGIAVTNTPDVLTEATADIAMLCLLGAARRAHEGDVLVRSGRWGRWTPTELLGAELNGKRLGIFGMGRIGQAMARRARGFGLKLLYCDQRKLPAKFAQGARFVADFDHFLAQCDILSLHAPATKETHHFLNTARIDRLPQGAIVVNTARGTLVDDDALIAALRTWRVAAAGLDVFENEPKLHRGYLELPNVFILPHLGSATVETRDAMGFRALDNLDAFFGGKTPRDRVNSRRAGIPSRRTART